MVKVFLIIIAIIVVAFLIFRVLLKKAEKKQADIKMQVDSMAQEMSMLIIDKKKMKLKDANLPSIVMENVPMISKLIKMPIVKVKIGHKITTMLCDMNVFNQLPIKKECKLVVSGLYITKIKSVRGTGKLESVSFKQKKNRSLKNLFSKFRNKK